MDGLRNFCSPSQCAAAPFLLPPLTLPFILVQTCSLHNPIPVSCSTLYAVPMHTQQTGGGGHSGAYSTPSPVPRSPGRQELRLLLILLLNGFLSCSSIKWQWIWDSLGPLEDKDFGGADISVQFPKSLFKRPGEEQRMKTLSSPSLSKCLLISWSLCRPCLCPS